MEEHQSEWTRSMSGKEQWSVVKRMLTYTKPYWKYFLPSIILTFVLSAVNMLLPRIIQTFIDNYLSQGNTGFNIFLFFAFLYFAAVIIKAIVWFFQYSLYLKGSVATSQSIRLALYKKVQSLGMRYFDQTPAGSIVSRVTNDTETLFDFWFVFQTVLTGIFGIITGIVAMWLINPDLTIRIMWFLPLLVVIVWYYQKFSSRVYRQMREKLSQLNTKLNESISGMAIIQQFRQEKRLEAEFETINNDYLTTKRAMIRTNSLLLAPVINLLVALSTALVLYFFGQLSLERLIDVGMIYAFITYVQNFFQPMINMMDFLSVFQDGLVASSRILKIMDHEELAPQQNEGADATIQNGKVEFKNVSFAYDGENKVLKNISFVANPGETVALVGHTGSGKSSIINVMMRFYEFSEGHIFIDDKDIRDFSMAELRDKMGLVLQDAFMFYGDIKSNIRLLDESISDEKIIEAAEFVQADTFIHSLPDGYDAKVIERGASYSSGQRQLISFARTIVTDPKILVLDEATANIDTETEGLIQEGLQRMRKGRTTIAIAHRLSTIRDANLILVLDKGEIAEQGTHDELIAKGGLYYDMYRLQNAHD